MQSNSIITIENWNDTVYNSQAPIGKWIGDCSEFSVLAMVGKLVVVFFDVPSLGMAYWEKMVSFHVLKSLLLILFNLLI